ncbi:uncharacterized protein LOC118195773 isoform X1 [Stegodyphus dumicola]|uniref:uncharacterized protein LOC118195773 isoform X1 n=1 Tax=Stegodyphus dumicola TaxID=202533 RepID=UPI0015B252C7|nr:uncharacterized protein LOC118195773 isoform X1 [Stegodyphus dumicola]
MVTPLLTFDSFAILSRLRCVIGTCTEPNSFAPKERTDSHSQSVLDFACLSRRLLKEFSTNMTKRSFDEFMKNQDSVDYEAYMSDSEIVMEQQLIKMKDYIKHMMRTVRADIQLNRPRALNDLRLLENESRFYKSLDAHVTRGTVINIAEMEEIKAVHIAVRSLERVYVEFCLSLGVTFCQHGLRRPNCFAHRL